MKRRRLATCAPLTVLLSLGAAPGCSTEPRGVEEAVTTPSPAGTQDGAAWLRGDTEARFRLVAKHLRGFDVAMTETGNRYAELYWAGHDRNWGYADYQLGKIETAIGNGVERRPKRAVSARMIDGAIVGVRAAIRAGDGPAFDAAFATMTATCNACHQAEKVEFIRVGPPAVRTSVVTGPTPDAGAAVSP